ncbi:hypothetical protein MCOR24_001134 [Pyricularia oryzae]|nr:hypothetical protein MCOR24_001134 [Pyricularia oryzae]
MFFRRQYVGGKRTRAKCKDGRDVWVVPRALQATPYLHRSPQKLEPAGHRPTDRFRAAPIVSTGLEPQTDVNVKYIASMYGVYVSSYCLATSTNATTPLQLMLWSESRHEFNQLAWYWESKAPFGYFRRRLRQSGIFVTEAGGRPGKRSTTCSAYIYQFGRCAHWVSICPSPGSLVPMAISHQGLFPLSSWWLAPLENGRNASFESISNAPSLFAEAVVNRIRLGDPEWQIECGDSNYGGAIVRGEVWEMAICTVPCWEWLIFPLTIIFLAMILLMGAQVQTLLTGPGNLSQL